MLVHIHVDNWKEETLVVTSFFVGIAFVVGARTAFEANNQVLGWAFVFAAVIAFGISIFMPKDRPRNKNGS